MLSAERVRRIRWRARRGLLENDIVLSRFLDSHEHAMTEKEVAALDRLLDLPDPELLDLILRRADASGSLDSPEVRSLLIRLREA